MLFHGSLFRGPDFSSTSCPCCDGCSSCEILPTASCCPGVHASQDCLPLTVVMEGLKVWAVLIRTRLWWDVTGKGFYVHKRWLSAMQHDLKWQVYRLRVAIAPQSILKMYGNVSLTFWNIFIICSPSLFFFLHFSRTALLERSQTKLSVFCDCLTVYVDVFALNGWIAGRGSLPAWIRSTRGVSLLWGLREALWGGLLVSGCTFPIGCFCLTKTQWDSGLLKDTVSLSCSLQEIICFVLITSYSIDETLLFWWDLLILMGSFCVINIWMESECQFYSLIQSAVLWSDPNIM